MSFTLSIATQYGELTLPSTDFVSADFDSTNGWADIRTKSVALRVQYKPEESALQATTEVGAVIVDLTKVVSISALYAEAPNWVPPEVSQPYDEGDQASASLSDIYSQPATLMDLPPYEYGAEAPYYWPPDYPTEPYCYTDEYPYSWGPTSGSGSSGSRISGAASASTGITRDSAAGSSIRVPEPSGAETAYGVPMAHRLVNSMRRPTRGP